MLLLTSLQGQTREDSLAVLLDRAGEDAERIRLLYELARLDGYNDRERALSYLVRITELEKDSFSRAALLDTLGLFNWQTGRYDDALHYFNQSWVLFETLGDSAWMGKVANNQGVVFLGLGYRSEAMEHYRKALEIRKNIGDLHGVALVSSNIGNIYQDWERYEEAYTWYREALDIATLLGETRPLAYANASMGNYFAEHQVYDSALYYHLLSFGNALKEEDHRSHTYVLGNIGNVYFDMGEIDSALHYFRQSVSHARRINNKYRLAVAEYRLGRAYLALNNLDSARANIGRSYRFAYDNNHPELRIDNYFTKAEIEERSGNTERSLKYYKTASTLKEAQNKSEFAKFTQMERNYHREREDQENALLRKNIEIQELTIRKQNITRIILIASAMLFLVILILIARSRLSFKRLSIKLQKSEEALLNLNADKDKFFSIISHDLKSPFNGLLGVSQVLDSSFDRLSPKERKDLIAVLKTSIANVYELVEELLQWARTQTGNMKLKLTDINLHELSKHVIEVLDASAAGKDLSLHNLVPADCMARADEKALETVVRNIVTNAIKFTNPGGKISIQTITDATQLTMAISDTGIGMSEEVRDSLFRIDVQHSSQGTNMETGTGLGLILSKELVESMQGRIWVESTPDKGSTFYFTLPLPKHKAGN